MEKFDCIIAGAGPAGVTAALHLARAGLNVIVFERGEYPGAKNVSGGILYSTVLNRLIPGFWKDAPIERHVIRRRYSVLSRDSEAAFDMRFSAFDSPPFNNTFTVLRSRFDRWYAAEAEKAGALIVAEAPVDGFIVEDGKVRGVEARIEGGHVYGDVVICAEGVNTLLAEKAGRPKPEARRTILGVKEVISLPPGVIEDRFSLEDGQGAAFEFFGSSLGGLAGSGFIYTNKDTLSVGIGTPISVLKERAAKPYELLDSFKGHPAVKRLLKGGTIEEYSAHMIPEGGLIDIDTLAGDGLLIVGDSAGFVNASLYKEGSNLAMASGLYAAETVMEAREKGDFSRATLKGYVQRLQESFVVKDLKRYSQAPETIQSMPGLFDEYPERMIEFLQGHFTVTEESKEEAHNELKRLLRKKVSFWRMLRDLYRMRRVIS